MNEMLPLWHLKVFPIAFIVFRPKGRGKFTRQWRACREHCKTVINILIAGGELRRPTIILLFV